MDTLTVYVVQLVILHKWLVLALNAVLDTYSYSKIGLLHMVLTQLQGELLVEKL